MKLSPPTKLLIFITFLFGAAFILPTPPEQKLYSWQNRCMSACVGLVGEAGMAWIHSRNCLELAVGLPYAMGNTDKASRARALAAYDKMASLGCISAQATYESPYQWQNRCDVQCAKTLEREELATIDAYDCETIQEQLPYARNPRLRSDYNDWVGLYNATAKAVLDKYDALNCN